MDVPEELTQLPIARGNVQAGAEWARIVDCVGVAAIGMDASTLRLELDLGKLRVRGRRCPYEARPFHRLRALNTTRFQATKGFA